MCVCMYVCVCMYLSTPSTSAECDMRSIFQWSLAGLNS